MKHLLAVFTEGIGEFSLQGRLVTSHCRYGSMQLLKIFVQHGLGVIVVMPDHPIRCHPFVGWSYLLVGRNDDEEEEDLIFYCRGTGRRIRSRAGI